MKIKSNKKEPLILQSMKAMTKEDKEEEEKYYSDKLHIEVVIIDGRYNVIPPIK